MPTVHDQRSQTRLTIAAADGLRGLFTVPDEAGGGAHRAPVRVVDLSLGGAALVGDPAIISPELQRGELRLARAGRALGDTEVAVVHCRQVSSADGPQHLVGVRFREQSEAFLRDLCCYLVEEHGDAGPPEPCVAFTSRLEEVTEPKRIGRLLVYCCRKRKRLRVHDAAGAPVADLWPQTVSAGRRVFGRLEWLRPCGAAQLAGPISLVFSSFTSVFVLPIAGLLLSGDRAGFAVPELMLEGGLRRHDRIAADERFEVALEFLHPQVPGKLVRKIAEDVGLAGARFGLDVEQDLLAPGMVVDSAVLRLPDGQSVACRFAVRHVDRCEAGYRCGVELLSFPGSGHERWLQQVLAQLNPQICEAPPALLGEAWSVFERSGYLEEKPGELLARMRSAFIETWSRVHADGTHSRCWLYREGSCFSGLLSGSQMYSTTWLMHHIATDSALGAGRRLRALGTLMAHTTMQWLGSLEGVRYLIGFVDADKPFNQGGWLAFFDENPEKELQHVARQRMWECRAADAAKVEASLTGDVPADDVVVEPATGAMLHWVSGQLLLRDGPLLARALDYAPERIRLALGGALGRRREVFVATRDGEPVGLAYAELAAPALNIFSLYDMGRVVVTDESSARDAVRDALFARVARWYGEQGREDFLFMAGAGDEPPPPAVQGFAVRAIRPVFDVELIPAWAAYLTKLWNL